MKKYFARTMFVIAGAMFVVGIAFILSATSRGQNKGDDAIWANGGSLETSKYNLVVESSIKNYRTLGTVLSLVGGFGLVTISNAIYKELD